MIPRDNIQSIQQVPILGPSTKRSPCPNLCNHARKDATHLASRWLTALRKLLASSLCFSYQRSLSTRRS